MNKSFSLFLDNISENMREKGKTEGQIHQTLTKINDKYKNSPIFETITIKDLEDEDFDDYLGTNDEKENRDVDIMAQMTESTLENDDRAQRILTLQEYYKDKEVFKDDEMEGTEEIDNRGIFGRTQLHTAVLAQDLATIEELLDNGANPHMVDNNGFTPFQTANVEGYEDVMALFVSRGIDK